MRGQWMGWGARFARACGLVAIVAAGLGITPAADAQQRPDDQRRLVEILEGLEHGLAALERLGLREEQERLERVADRVRAQLERHRKAGGGLQELLAAARDEHADLQREIAELARDNEVSRQDLETRAVQRARLAQLIERLETARSTAEPRRRQADRRRAAVARDERIAALEARAQEMLRRDRQWRQVVPGSRREDREGRRPAPREALPPRLERLHARVAEIERGLEEVRRQLRAARLHSGSGSGR